MKAYKGQFELKVISADGKIKETLPLQDNLILNNFYSVWENLSTNSIKLEDGSYAKVQDLGKGNTRILSVVFGIGDTPPSKSDFKLENEVIKSNIQIRPIIGRKLTQEKGDIYSSLFTYKEDFPVTVRTTIKELGLYISSNSYSGIGSLLTRSVLDKPVSVNDGDIIQLTYHIKEFIDLERKQEVLTLNIDGVLKRFNLVIQPIITEKNLRDTPYHVIDLKSSFSNATWTADSVIPFLDECKNTCVNNYQSNGELEYVLESIINRHLDSNYYYYEKDMGNPKVTITSNISTETSVYTEVNVSYGIKVNQDNGITIICMDDFIACVLPDADGKGIVLSDKHTFKFGYTKKLDPHNQ